MPAYYRMTVLLPPELEGRVKLAAAADSRSASNWVRRVIEAALAPESLVVSDEALLAWEKFGATAPGKIRSRA